MSNTQKADQDITLVGAVLGPVKPLGAPLTRLTGLHLADAIDEAHGERIRKFARERRLRGERGVVVIRATTPAGPLGWITYSPAAMRALGVHPSDHLAHWMRCDRDIRAGRSLQCCVIVDDAGRRLECLHYRADGADGRGGEA